MTTPPDRYRVTLQHGEYATLYYVVDSAAPEQPAVIDSFSTSRYGAEARTLAYDLAESRNFALLRA